MELLLSKMSINLNGVWNASNSAFIASWIMLNLGNCYVNWILLADILSNVVWCNPIANWSISNVNDLTPKLMVVSLISTDLKSVWNYLFSNYSWSNSNICCSNSNVRSGIRHLISNVNVNLFLSNGSWSNLQVDWSRLADISQCQLLSVEY